MSLLSLGELRERYLAHARRYYRRQSGEPTREHMNVSAALDRFIAFAGDSSPGARVNRHQVKAWVDQLAAEELSRVYVNQCLSRVRRWIRWCADLELIPFSVTEDLRRVHPLAALRSEAKEPRKIKPPPLDQVAQILPLLPPMARDVMHLGKLTGARPGELLALYNGEVVIDDAGPRLVPAQHKSAHHGLLRIIPLSEEALAIIARRWRPLLPLDRVFATDSQAGHYSIEGYRGAVRRACRRAGIPPFRPYDVRHAVGRHVRRHRGLDAAQALLGHTDSRTTEIYAPLDAGDAETLYAARRATEVL